MPSSKPKNKKPQDHKPRQYGSKWGSPLHDLDLPSGELCQVKRPGVQGLIKAGVLESLDSLTGIVQGETLPKAQGKPQANVSAVANDPEKFGEMMARVDEIVVHCVTQPKVAKTVVTEEHARTDPFFNGAEVGRELNDEEKQHLVEKYSEDHPGHQLVFVDWIDEMDKMFIMSFVMGGSSDLEEFRAATTQAVGGASDVAEVPGSPE